MRVGIATLFIFALLVGGSYWYRTTQYECPVPLSYRLGELSSEFDITPEQAQEYIETATGIWEDATRRDLFVYDEQADFTVDFVFDERQALADSEAAQRDALDAQKGENEEIFATVETLQTEYNELKETYEGRAADYDARLSEYNDTVSIYNDRGGAPADIFAELEANRVALDVEADSLSQTAKALNELAQQINTLSIEGNDRVASYNRDVDRYNDRFGHAHEFVQGDYRGDSINIYKFSEENELITVLVHEFGHALGIDHIEDESAIMHYLLGDTSEAPALTGADLAAFIEVCDTEATWEQLARAFIRSLF